MADISQIQFPDGTVYDIKDPVARAAAGDAGAGKIFYGVCSTASATQTKVVTIEDFELFSGALIAVKFENVNTATSPMLNISGTGAINMYSVGTTAVLPNAWSAGETLLFVYNGTSYMVADGGIASTSGYGATKLNSSTSSTSTTEAATPSAVKSAYDLALEAKTSASDGKSLIASAITGKGVSTSATDTFATMADNINAIETGIEITNGKIVQYKAAESVIPANTFVELLTNIQNSYSTNSTSMTTSSTAGFSVGVPISTISAVFSYYTGSSSKTQYIRRFNGTAWGGQLSITQSGYYCTPSIIVENSLVFIYVRTYSYSQSHCIRIYDSNNNTLGPLCTLDISSNFLIGIHYIGNNKYIALFGDNVDSSGIANRYIYIKLLEYNPTDLSLSVSSGASVSIGQTSAQQVSTFTQYSFFETLQDGSIIFVSSHYYASETNKRVRFALLINIDATDTIRFKLYNYSNAERALLLCLLDNGNFVRIEDSVCYLHSYSGSFSNGYSVTSSAENTSDILTAVTQNSNYPSFIRLSNNTYVAHLKLSANYSPTLKEYYLGFSPSLVNTYTTALPKNYYYNNLSVDCCNSLVENHIQFAYLTTHLGFSSSAPEPVVFDTNFSRGITYPITKINGVTVDEITTQVAGDVWVLDS